MNNTTQASRFGMVAKSTSVLLSAAILASGFSFLGGTFAAPQVDAASTVDYIVDDQQNGSILQCFNWSFTAIKNNMAKIAEQGFTAVQTSPIQTAKETTAGKTAKGSWWALYQPADFTIETNANGTGALGTATEFRAMCEEAHKYGVRVIVDAVLNHMANQNKNDLSPAIPAKYRNDSNFWHDISKNSWYASRHDITQYCMDGVPDLNTGYSGVQNAAISFLKECIDCGADGFRFDGAKHIEVPVDSGFGSQFWPNVIGTTTSYAQQTRGITPYYYGEVLDKPTGDNDISSGQTVANSYTQYMSVTMSGVSNDIRNKVNGGDATNAKRSDYNFDGGAGSVSGNKAVLWNESHDTYQAGHSSGVSDYKINQTWALVGSRATSCGMYLARPSNWGSAMMGQGDVTAWANAEVKAVNEFNNAFVGEGEYLSASDGVAYNERGTAGVVIVNCQGGSKSVNLTANKMAAGTYKDQITGNTFTVSNGKISGQVGSTGIAVVYNAGPIVHSAVVSATPDSGSYTDSVTATLGVKNAASGTYSTSDGKSGTYTNGQTITFGSSVAVGGTVTLTLSAKGEDGETKTKTYTYTKKDPNAVTSIYFDNSTYNWSNVYVYIYNKSDEPDPPTPSGQIVFTDNKGWGSAYAYFFTGNTAVGAAWPGTAMTSIGNNDMGQAQYKIDVPSGATGVVFNNGNGTQTVDATVTSNTGYYCKDSTDGQGHYEVGTWALTSSSADTTVCNAAWPGAKMTMDASTGYYKYEVPDNLVNGYAMFSDGTDTASKRYPADGEEGLSIGDSTKLFAANYSWTDYSPVPPTKDPVVKCNKTTGTSFSTETFDITLSLENATSGTYTVDGGPTKSFTSTKTVTIGEGKIGDSTVTVETTATNSEGTTKSYTFTFEKKYVVKTTSSSANLSSYYSTNKSGVGVNKTITVDGNISDWNSTMIIAQGTANDDPRVYRPNSMYEVPLDLYTLYGAYDDNNLYLMWEMTNVQDVVAPNDDYPLSQGILYQTMNIPFFIAIDTKKSDAIGNSGMTTAGGTIWNSGITFKNSFNRLIAISTNGANGPFVYGGTSSGLNPVEIYNAKTSGITFDYGLGILSQNVYGIDGAYGVNNNRVVGDMCSDSAAWVDFNTKGHKANSATMDFHYEMSVPLSILGVTKSDIQSNGIGALLIMTSGQSGMDCLPYDLSMNDQADLDDSAGSQENNSFEKSDEDYITTTFAGIGKKYDGTDPGPGPQPTTALQANFGTDKSAPQLTTTALTLKAIGMGGTAPYTYTFKVDGATVKADSSTATYTWTPSTAGQHTISCIIKDSTGATDTTTKTFTAEGSDVTVDVTSVTLSKTSLSLTPGGTATLTATVAPANATNKTITWSSNKTSVATVNSSGKVTAVAAGTATITATSNNGKTATCTVTVSSNPGTLVNESTINSEYLSVGQSVVYSGAASGGTAPYKYAFYYKRSSGKVWKAVGTEFGSTTAISFATTAAADYDIKITVKDATGATVDKEFKVSVSDGKSTAFQNTSTISTTGGKVGTKVRVYASATGSSGYTYAFYYKRTTARLWHRQKTGEFSTTSAYQFTPTDEGVIDVRVDVKDKNNNIVSRHFTVTISNDYVDTTTVVNLTASAYSAAPNTRITVTANPTGGTAPYKYAFYYKRVEGKSWNLIGTAFGSTNYASLKPSSVGEFVFMAQVKDAKGGMTSENVNVEITSNPTVNSQLVNSSSVSSNSVSAGSKVTMTGAASGGTAPYTYAFSCKKSTESDYSVIGSGYTSTSTATKTFSTAGVYDVKISVKDATGTVVDRTFAVIVS